MSGTFKVALTGECNRCGLCCRMGDYRCEHLEEVDGATRCRAYDRRYDGMPIMMIGPAHSAASVCHKDSDAETQIILQRGIGQGCSLIVNINGRVAQMVEHGSEEPGVGGSKPPSSTI